jgi:anti-anti-sigma factor
MGRPEPRLDEGFFGHRPRPLGEANGRQAGPRSSDQILQSACLADEGGVRVVFRGELDVCDLAAAEPDLRAAERAAGRLPLTIDLRGITFCSEAAIYLLMDALDLAEQDRRVLIVNPGQAVRRLLEMGDLAHLFNLEATSGRGF